MKVKLTGRGGRIMWVLLIGSLLALFGGTGVVTAMGAADPVRGLPEDDLMPGEGFEVTVTFTSPHDDLHAVGLSDVAPDGWNVSVDTAWTSPTAMDANMPQPDEAAYVWGGPYDAGTEFTVVYKVEVPSDAAPGPYTFPGGFLEYYVEGFPADSYIEPITGDYEVEVAEKEEPNGVPPVGGSAYPVNVLTLLLPWLGLAAIVAGATLLVLRRRRTQN